MTLKNKFINIISAILIFSCQPVLYNSIDINSDVKMLDLEPPVKVSASNGNYKQYIKISWSFFSQMNISFHLYRSLKPDSDFELLNSEINVNYYYDKSAIPQVTYYYKLKAVSIIEGESPFCDVVEGKRAGLGFDLFESIEPDSYPEMETAKQYHRSFYPEGDADYMLIKCKANSIKTASFMNTDVTEANVSDFSIKFYDLLDMEKPIHIVDSFEAGKVFKISTPSDLDIVAVVKAKYEGETGDYLFTVNELDKDKVINNLTVSVDYSGYIKINWDRESYFQYYRIERKKNDTEWQIVKMSESVFRRDVVDKIKTEYSVYDFNTEPDIEYQYRVIGYVTDDFYRYSVDEIKGKRNSVKPDLYEVDDTAASLNITDLPIKEQKRTITDGNDIDYIKVKMEESKSYSIILKYIDSYKMTAGLSIINSSGDVVYFEPPSEDREVRVTEFQCLAEGIYQIKIEGFTVSGEYSLSIMENK